MFIVIRRAASAKERDEAYNEMIEGRPKTTPTLGTRVARFEEAMAQTVARQLNGMFPRNRWEVMPEGEFRYQRPSPHISDNASTAPSA